MRKYTLAFDVYGTLINTEGVFKTLEQFVGNKAQELMQTWREKQLEYSFRRGLMGKYVDFARCTQEALIFACNKYQIVLNGLERNTLLDSYTKLPIFEDVRESLERLKKTGHRLFAFSNGSKLAITKLLQHAEVAHLFQDLISVEKTQTFKPSPLAYTHFNQETQSEKSNSILISSNSFDVLGASAYGMKTVFLQRHKGNILDAWEFKPDFIIKSLTTLIETLSR